MYADVARIKRDMDLVRGHVGSAMQGVERAVGAATAALGLLGAGVGLAGLARLARDAIDSADQLGKLAQKTGIAVDELSKLKYAASLSDVSTESLSKGIKGLAQRMTEATDSTSKAGQIMKALGVDINAGASPAIDKIADAFAQIPDGTTKAALAVEVFGKSGMDMIPLLNQGAGGIRTLKDEAIRLGVVMDEQSARAAEAFNDNMRAVRASSEGTANALLERFSPSLVRVSAAVKQAAIDSGILAAVWVGLGGIASEVLGLNATEIEKTKKKIRELQEETLKLRLVEATDLGGGVYDRARVVQAQALLKVLGQELRMYEELRIALEGGYQDQVSRRQQQGKGIAAGVNSDLEARLKSILGGGSMAKAMKELGDANAHVVQWFKALVAEAKLANDEVEKSIDLDEKLRVAKEAAAGSFRENVEQMEFEVTLLGKSNADREIAIRLRALEAAGFDVSTESVKGYVERIRAAVEANEAFRLGQEEIRNQVSVWGQVGDAVGGFLNALTEGFKSGIDYARQLLKRLLADMVAIFAKRWVLQLAASAVGGSAGDALANAAGGAGQGSMAGSLLTAGSSYLFGTAETVTSTGLMIPATEGLLGGLGQTVAPFLPWVAAAIAIYSLWQAFKDKGENPNFRLFQGTGGAGDFGGLRTEGNFGFETSDLFKYVGGLDQRFMNLLGTEGSASASARLAAYTGAGLRMDGQPAQFAIPEGSEKEGAEQITKELLQSRYGILFEGIDKGFADTIKEWSGNSTDLAQFIETALGIIEGLGKLGIKGLDIETLRSLQVEGEAIGDTFNRVANAWAWFNENFYTDAEKFEKTQQSVIDVFKEMGIEVPDSIKAFRELVLSLDASDPQWQSLMEIAPLFLEMRTELDRLAETVTETTEAIDDMVVMTADLQRQIEQTVIDDRRRKLDNVISARGGLQDFLRSTRLDPSLSPLDPFQRLGIAEGEFNRILQLAQGGDLNAAGQLGGAGQAYLQIARELYKSSPQYVDIFNRVTGAVQGVDDRLAFDQRMLEATLGIANSLESIKDILLEIRDNGTGGDERIAVAAESSAAPLGQR